MSVASVGRNLPIAILKKLGNKDGRQARLRMTMKVRMMRLFRERFLQGQIY
jgi:hypothetical protein